nr:reverse transcriptase domain-containing protein [Tanacetum cinerariifolium]
MYAANEGINRRCLWEELIKESRFVNGNPWCTAGDMNVTLKIVFHCSRKKVSDEATVKMIVDVFDNEIKKAMFEIDDSKAPGPDGFNAAFFKKPWSIIRTDVCKAVREFFMSGRMLVIKRALDKFSAYSRLLPHNSKSTVFFGSLCEEKRYTITNVLLFAIGKLPVRWPKKCYEKFHMITNIDVLVLDAAVADKERNGRIFKEAKRNSEELVKSIVDTVKHKLLGLIVKDSSAVRDIERKWAIFCKKVSSKKLQLMIVKQAIHWTSTSEASVMTNPAIRKLVANSVATALEAQAATMVSTNNPNRNSGPRKTLVAKKCTYEKFMSYQPFYFNGTEGSVGLIHWFKWTKSVFSRSNYAKKNKVKFAINTLTEEDLFWWNSFAQPIGVKEAYKNTWSEFKRLLIKKYCPQTEIKKMEEAITMTQKLIEQVMKWNSVQKNNNHKRKLEDRRNTTNENNNNYRNNNRSNDHHQQHNRKQETFRTYTATNGLVIQISCQNSLRQESHPHSYNGETLIIQESAITVRIMSIVEVPIVDQIVKRGSNEGENKIDSLTKEPADTLLIEDEVISTNPARENDEFIKSGVHDLVPIPRKSEVMLVCNDLECDITVTIPLPTTNVREEIFDINSPLGEQVVDFFMENKDVAGLPRHLEFKDISSLDPPKSAPLNNELLEGYILFLKHLLIKEIFFDPTPAVLPKKSTLLATPPLASKKISLRDVERFDPFFSLTLSGRKTRLMETSSFSFHHMPSPRPAAYSPKEVMYCYYHPHLTSEIPSNESKVHIKVLSVLWGNRLPILDGSLPLS